MYRESELQHLMAENSRLKQENADLRVDYLQLQTAHDIAKEGCLRYKTKLEAMSTGGDRFGFFLFALIPFMVGLVLGMAIVSG
jgi:hypothetical protein